ncbi:MAG: ATP-dependent 6-phosphofructokinase [Victivallales bacterium]|nr:ATP-dependent 6-phosphofructokinase [Victivallales bacterium]
MENLDFKIKKLGKATIQSPLADVHFESENSSIAYHKDASRLRQELEKTGTLTSFEKAGPRAKIYHDPSWSKAAILTAGGLCPGLNDVIKGLTRTLMVRYKVPIVYGIKYGYQGLNPEYGYEPIMLTPDLVDDIHEAGGTILGSSRGRIDENIMADTLERMNINLLFCIGGDGTLRCAHDVVKVIEKRKLNISVICIPKTIDNDINFMDQTFGFETAVYATNSVITSAHYEAKGAPNGIGLIRVMGRDSGFIAAYATLANTHINYCLIPEEEFSMDELFTSLEKRLRVRKHAVIIAAEGAGQHLFNEDSVKKDKSGNKLHNNIGMYLHEQLDDWATKKGLELNVKYFDPSYMIRSLPAHGTDAVFCQMLAMNAVHAALSGCTDTVIGHWHDSFTHVPIAMATRERKKIDLHSSLWTGVRSVTWDNNWKSHLY